LVLPKVFSKSGKISKSEAPDSSEGRLEKISKSEAPDSSEGRLGKISKSEAPDSSEGRLGKISKSEAPDSSEGRLEKIEMLFTLLSYGTTCPVTKQKQKQTNNQNVFR